MSNGMPTDNRVGLALWVVACVFVIGALIAGFVVYGGPLHQRALRIDNQRVHDIAGLNRRIVVYHGKYGKLPEGLADVASVGEYDAQLRSDKSLPVDPRSKKPYEYAKVTPEQYHLCATFSTDSKSSRSRNQDPFLQHTKGRNCYTNALTNWFQRDPKQRKFSEHFLRREP